MKAKHNDPTATANQPSNLGKCSKLRVLTSLQCLINHVLLFEHTANGINKLALLIIENPWLAQGHSQQCRSLGAEADLKGCLSPGYMPLSIESLGKIRRYIPCLLEVGTSKHGTVEFGVRKIGLEEVCIAQVRLR